MYRPGWFPEYNPQEQKVFDKIQDIIRTVFEQRNFQHIWTPAVESNEILLKWWDTVANEIFWLVGLKDFERGEIERSKKSYSLHFDLTVPFARYTLDHSRSITFPFKRYQMQPVWRGERQQRWRFKEFWQCDVDSIWKSGTNVGYWYAVETIATLQSAIGAIFSEFWVTLWFKSHISHIGLTKQFLHDILNHDADKVQAVVNLLDKFYKKEYGEFAQELKVLIGEQSAWVVLQMIESGDYSPLAQYEGYTLLDKTITTLQSLWCRVEYDLTIVRGLGYYTDIVFETFIDSEISLGSICSGGWYEDFTKFIDPKNVFSGIGGSIGLSRLMEMIVGQESTMQDKPAYMFLNFDDTFSEILKLYKQFIADGKTCELYPVEAKFGKQLEYADKKWCQYAVILWWNELGKGIYQIKDLKSGEVKSVELRV